MLGKLPDAYFDMINEQGGIDGVKITYVSYDDAYSPPKTVEQARRLVENANLNNFAADLTINTSPTDCYPIEQLQLIRFDGERYRRLGEIIDSSQPS